MIKIPKGIGSEALERQAREAWIFCSPKSPQILLNVEIDFQVWLKVLHVLAHFAQIMPPNGRKQL